MEIKISQLIQKELNNSCLIIGPGPTMNDFPFKNFKGVIISIGDSAIRGKNFFTPNYWVCSNSHFPVPEIAYHLDIINSFEKTTFLFAETELYGLLWSKSQHYLNTHLKINWCVYDERHFLGKNCQPKKNCCNLIRSRDGVFTIQELVSKIYNFPKIAKQGGSVFEYALCLSLILGCSPIYIQGVDLPTNSAIPSRDIDYVQHGDLGQKYYVDPVSKSELLELYKKTSLDISMQVNKNIKKNMLFFFKKIFNLKKYLFNFFFKIKLKGFSDSIETILHNCGIYSQIAKENNKKIFYLSANSSLKNIKNLSYVNSKNLIF